MAFNQDVRAILPSKSVDSRYLVRALLFRAAALVPEIGTSAHGTRRLGSSSLEKLLVPLPPSEAQGRVSAALGAADRKTGAEEQRLAALRGLFRTMLHLLMTGRVRAKALS